MISTGLPTIYYYRWIFGEVFCHLISGLTHIHYYAGVFFLALMSLDRVLAVVFFKKRRARQENCYVMTRGIKIIKVNFFLVAQKLMKPIIAKKLR